MVVVALVGLVGSGPVSAAVDGLPNRPSPPTISADTAYLDGLQSTYDQHLATIDALAAEIKANRSKLDDLLEQHQRSAKATELCNRVYFEKRRAVEAEITALDMPITGLRSRSEALSTSCKAKTSICSRRSTSRSPSELSWIGWCSSRRGGSGSRSR